MKNLKSIKILILMAVLSVMTGCSDSIVSPENQINKTDSFKPDIKEKNIRRIDYYHATVSIKPGKSVSFNHENTGYYTLNSISVLNCEEAKRQLDISAYMEGGAIVLGCNSGGFNVKEIVIFNISSELVEVDLFLTGSKVKIVKHSDYRAD